jgi:hypothetical protein
MHAFPIFSRSPPSANLRSLPSRFFSRSPPRKLHAIVIFISAIVDQIPDRSADVYDAISWKTTTTTPPPPLLLLPSPPSPLTTESSARLRARPLIQRTSFWQ